MNKKELMETKLTTEHVYDEYGFADSRTERRANGERGKMKLQAKLNMKHERKLFTL